MKHYRLLLSILDSSFCYSFCENYWVNSGWKFRYYSIFVWLWVGWHKYKAGKHAKLLLVALILGLNKINILMHACIKWKVSQVAIGCMKSGTTIQPIQLVAVLKMMKVLLWKRWRGENYKLCGKSFFLWNIQVENSLEQQCTHGQGEGRVPLNTLYFGRNKYKLLFQTTWCPTNNFLLLPMMSPQTKTI